MKKVYLRPQQAIVSMYHFLPIIAASGGGSSEPANPGDPSIGGGGNEGEPIEEGGAPGMMIWDDHD